MPVVIVYGFPASTEDLWRDSLPVKIKNCVASIRELKLTSKDVTVFFPTDVRFSRDYTTGEIIVMVEGLFKKPERTPEVRKNLADALAKEVMTVGRVHCDIKMVEVLVKEFDPDHDGFARIDA